MTNGVVCSDENGFRNDKEIDLKGKIVVGVFGGSVAQGSCASDNNHTISGRLQYYLRKEYGDNIVVLNFAGSSYTQMQEISIFNLFYSTFNFRISYHRNPGPLIQFHALKITH